MNNQWKTNKQTTKNNKNPKERNTANQTKITHARTHRWLTAFFPPPLPLPLPSVLSVIFVRILTTAKPRVRYKDEYTYFVGQYSISPKQWVLHTHTRVNTFHTKRCSSLMFFFEVFISKSNIWMEKYIRRFKKSRMPLKGNVSKAFNYIFCSWLYLFWLISKFKGNFHK